MIEKHPNDSNKPYQEWFKMEQINTNNLAKTFQDCANCDVTLDISES